MLKACLAASRTRLGQYCVDQQLQNTNIQVIKFLGNLIFSHEYILIFISFSTTGGRTGGAEEQLDSHPGEHCHPDPPRDMPGDQGGAPGQVKTLRCPGDSKCSLLLSSSSIYRGHQHDLGQVGSLSGISTFTIRGDNSRSTKPIHLPRHISRAPFTTKHWKTGVCSGFNLPFMRHMVNAKEFVVCKTCC